MKSIMRLNAEADPSYCPYCLRCPSLVRMVKVESFLWRCHCGAEHDERIEMHDRERLEMAVDCLRRYADTETYKGMCKTHGMWSILSKDANDVLEALGFPRVERKTT